MTINFLVFCYCLICLCFIQQYWIGLNDLAVAGRWVWESFTKELVTFTNWQSGEPNGLGKERCTEMYGGSQAGFWNDAPCANVKRYICEKEEGNSKV